MILNQVSIITIVVVLCIWNHHGDSNEQKKLQEQFKKEGKRAIADLMKELEELKREIQNNHITRREVQSLQSMRTRVTKMRKVRGVGLAGPATTATTGTASGLSLTSTSTGPTSGFSLTGLTPAKTTASEVSFGGLGADTTSTGMGTTSMLGGLGADTTSIGMGTASMFDWLGAGTTSTGMETTSTFGGLGAGTASTGMGTTSMFGGLGAGTASTDMGTSSDATPSFGFTNPSATTAASTSSEDGFFGGADAINALDDAERVFEEDNIFRQDDAMLDKNKTLMTSWLRSPAQGMTQYFGGGSDLTRPDFGMTINSTTLVDSHSLSEDEDPTPTVLSSSPVVTSAGHSMESDSPLDLTKK